MLIAVGADMVRRRPAGSIQSDLPVVAPPSGSRTGVIWRSLLPYPLVPLVAGLAIFALVAGRRVELQDGVFLGGAVLIDLVVVRQILVILENAHLYEDVQRTNEKLEALSTTDPLTNLPNHRALMNVLDLELERASRYRRP